MPMGAKRKRPWGRIVCFGGAFIASLGVNVDVNHGPDNLAAGIVCAALLISGVALYGISVFKRPA